MDCSVAAAWALADERTEWTSAALKAATVEGAIVPSLFWFEIRNILVVNERRGRIKQMQPARFLADIDLLTDVDVRPVESDLLELARTHNLTVYDAGYLELASRLGLPLCTLDTQLIQAAPKIGVTLWRPSA
ncbi:MAG: type II toxin-antitoxin system VapC family toxin [Candidatus Acidiferrales bacterium]